MGGQSERLCGRPFKRPWESEVGGRMNLRWGHARLMWEAMGVQGGRPHESKVGGHMSPKWEAARGQGGRPWEAEVGGRGRLKWEAV